MHTSITINLNTKANASRCFNYLRRCSVLSKHYHRGRGDHCLHIFLPTTRTPDSMRQSLVAAGFEFVYMGSDNHN